MSQANVKKQNLDMTQGTPWKMLLAFAMPLLLGNVFQVLYNTVDSIVVGQYVGATALAAVGTAMPTINLLLALFNGIATGSTIIIAQYYGAQRYEDVHKANTTIMIMTFGLGIVMSILGVSLAPWILHLTNVPEDVFDQALDYMRIFCGGVVFMMFYNIISGILRGLGDSKRPLYFLIISCCVNIVLDLLFVVVFRWGVAGVAIATVAAQAVAVVFAIARMNVISPYLRIDFKHLVFDKNMAWLSVRLGIPSGIQMMAMNIGNILVQSVINSFGSVIMAACNMVMRVDSFLMIPQFTMGLAVTPFVGQNIGAQKMDRVKKGIRAGFVLLFIIIAVMTVLLYLFSGSVMRAFTSDAAVLEAGLRQLYIILPFYIFVGIGFMFTSVLRGAGDTVIPMVNSILTNVLLRLPLVFWFTKLPMGSDGIYWSMVVVWIIGTIFMFVYYLSGKWKSKSVMNREKPGSALQNKA